MSDRFVNLSTSVSALSGPQTLRLRANFPNAGGVQFVDATGAVVDLTPAASLLASNNTWTGTNTFAPTPNATGQTAVTVTPAANGAITAGALVPSALFGSFSPITRTWATGPIPVQAEYVFAPPTYAAAGASTMDMAATIYIPAAPSAGANMTITRSVALAVDGEASLSTTTTGTLTVKNDLLLDTSGVTGTLSVTGTNHNLTLAQNGAGTLSLSVGATGNLQLGGNAAAKVGFYNVTPVARQLLATGTGATVDNVITALQLIGILRQA